MKISFFSIKTQFENVGDALINREMIRLAKAHGDVVVDVSRCPPEFAALLDPGSDGVGRVFWLNSTRALFQRILAERLRGSRCYYYISPGGYVGERAGTQFLTGLFNSAALKIMNAVGVAIVHIGVSYERLGRSHIRLLKGRSGMLRAHLVRDADSAAYARSLGLRVDGIMPDLAFGAYGRPAFTNQPRQDVAFSFRTDQSEQMRQQFRDLVNRLDAELPSDVPFRFVSQVRRDGAFLEELSKLPLRRPVSFHDVSGNIDLCMVQYDACTHIVSNRLHALLSGLLRGARPLPLVDVAHNQKIIGIFSALDASIAPIDTQAAGWIGQVQDGLALGSVEPGIVEARHADLEMTGRKIYG